MAVIAARDPEARNVRLERGGVDAAHVRRLLVAKVCCRSAVFCGTSGKSGDFGPVLRHLACHKIEKRLTKTLSKAGPD
jgi:hypothetical protein